jgi:malate permease and related proteins
MDNIIILLLCLFLGYFLARTKIFPENAYITLNHLIIYVCLPALALLYMPQIEISTQMLFPVFVVYLLFIVGFIFINIIGKIFKFDRATTGALVLTCGFANTSFVGFPLLTMLFGEGSLKTGIIIDQAGSFIAVTTLGILTASYYSSSEPSGKVIVKKILQFPPFYSFIVGLLIRLLNIPVSPLMKDIFQKLGSPIYFLALLSVGMQLSFNFRGIKFAEIFWGLSYKLIFGPLVVFILYVLIIGGRGEIVQISIIESAMGPMVTAAILATNYNLNPRLVGLVTGIGIILSFGTVLLWYQVVRGF